MMKTVLVTRYNKYGTYLKNGPHLSDHIGGLLGSNTITSG